jgi:hypothetical protein
MNGDDIAVDQQGGGVDEGVADVLQRTPPPPNSLRVGVTAVWCARVAVDELARMLQGCDRWTGTGRRDVAA